jgi:WD40 repeat protein
MDEFLKKEFDAITKTKKSKPLVKASEVQPDPIASAPVKKMMKFGDIKEPSPLVSRPKPEPEKEKKVEKPSNKKPQDDDEIYEEDFEEFVEEPPQPPPKRPGSKFRGAEAPEYSLETLKRDLEKENAAALKREEELSLESSVHFSVRPQTENVDSKTIAKQQKRTKDLMEIVKLEKESFSIFELLPLTDYDDFTGKVQQGEFKNSGSQYNEDRVDRDVQCVDIAKKDVASQWPGDLGTGDLSAQNSSINKFLSKVGPMLEILLEENLEDKPSKVNVKKSEGTAGEILSSTALPSLDYLISKFPGSPFELKDLQFFPTKKNYLCAQYNLGESGSLLVIWDILNPSKPNRFLHSANEITSICISSSKEHIVLAGNSIGSLELWDIREPGSSHRLIQLDDKKKISLRSPTYSTDSIEIYTHEGKIQKIIEIPAGKGENFSILVSDSEGNLVTWSIIEMVSAEIEEMDFGLRIGGRVKLVKTHRTSIRELFPKNKTSACSALALDFSDGQRFLFASPNSLNYGSRFGMDTFPSIFEKTSTDITSISFAKSGNFQYFLTGSSCGTLSLYDKNFSDAIANWIDSVAGVVKVAWDASGRCGFFTIDKDQVLSVWDLKKLTNGPICKIKIQVNNWEAVDWVIPESSKHSLILAVADKKQVNVLNVK